MENTSAERIGQKLRALRKAKGLTQDQLSETLELNNRESISNWERDKPTIPSYRLKQLSDFYGVKPEEIIKLNISQLINLVESNESKIEPQQNKEKLLPLIGYIQTREDGYIEQEEAKEYEWLRFNSDETDSYVIKIKGNYLKPKIEQGEYILVAPNAIVMGGDIVIVYFGNDKKTIKRFLYERNNAFYFQSINETAETVEVSCSEIKNMLVIVATIYHPVFLK